MTVQQKQYLLAYLGYYTGDIDGRFGPQSVAATKAFQRDFCGISVDGICGEQTEKALKHAVAYGIEKKPDSTDCTNVQNNDAENSTNSNTGTFWDEIKYFTRDEPGIACPCGRCGGFPVEPTERLMRTADSIRDELGPMIPSSTVRCQAHNDELQGSAKNSRHIYGKAMDFNCPKSSQAQIEACLSRKKTAGEIRYWYRMSSGWYHFDVE